MKNKKLANNELNRISVDEFKQTTKTPIIVILDNIRSLNNIGSVFRTSDAFLIEKIYLCGYTAQPPHREIQKTALGATESVNWEYNQDIFEVLNSLQKDNTKIYAIEQTEDSIMLDEFSTNSDKIAVVFGNEVQGVQQEVINKCDGVIEIPQIGTKHSLNISVSCGVVLWDLFKKMKNRNKR